MKEPAKAAPRAGGRAQQTAAAKASQQSFKRALGTEPGPSGRCRDALHLSAEARSGSRASLACAHGAPIATVI